MTKQTVKLKPLRKRVIPKEEAVAEKETRTRRPRKRKGGVELIPKSEKSVTKLEVPESIKLEAPDAIHVAVDIPEFIDLDIPDFEWPTLTVDIPEFISLIAPTTISVEVEVEFEEGKKLRVGAQRQVVDENDIAGEQADLYEVLVDSLFDLVEQST